MSGASQNTHWDPVVVPQEKRPLVFVGKLPTTFTEAWNPKTKKGSLVIEFVQNALDHITDRGLPVATVPGDTPGVKMRLVHTETDKEVFSLTHTRDGIVLKQADTEFRLSFFLHCSTKDLTKAFCGGKGEGLKGVLFYYLKHGYTVTIETATKFFTVTFEKTTDKQHQVMTFTEYQQPDASAPSALVIKITGPADKVPFLHSLYQDNMFLSRSGDFNPATDDTIRLPLNDEEVPSVYCRGIYVRPSASPFVVNLATNGNADVLNGDRNSFCVYGFEAAETARILLVKLQQDAGFRREVYDHLAALPHIPTFFTCGHAAIRQSLLEEMTVVHAAALVDVPEGVTPWPIGRDSTRKSLYKMLGKHPVETSAALAAYLTRNWNPQRELETMLKKCAPVTPSPTKRKWMAEVEEMLTFACVQRRKCGWVFVDWTTKLGSGLLSDGLYDSRAETVYIDSRVLRIQSRAKFLMRVLGVTFGHISVSMHNLNECYGKVNDPRHVLTKSVKLDLVALLQSEADEKAPTVAVARGGPKRKGAPSLTPQATKRSKVEVNRQSTTTTTHSVRRLVPANLSKMRAVTRKTVNFCRPTGSTSSTSGRSASTTRPDIHVADTDECHRVPELELIDGILVEKGNASFRMTPVLKTNVVTLRWFTTEVFASAPGMPRIVPAMFSGDVRGFYSTSEHAIYVNLRFHIGRDMTTLELLAHELAHASCARLRLPTPHNATFASHMTQIALQFEPAFRRAVVAASCGSSSSSSAAAAVNSGDNKGCAIDLTCN